MNYKNFFRENGYVIIKNFYPRKYYNDVFFSLNNIFINGRYKKIYSDIKYVEKEKKISKFITIIKSRDPKYISNLYNSFGLNLSLNQFLNNKLKKKIFEICELDFRNMHLEQQLLRMDPPKINDNLTDLHQDHLPNSKKQFCSKLYGITLWCAFKHTDAVNGGILVKPKSHKLGYITTIKKSKIKYQSAKFGIQKKFKHMMNSLKLIKVDRGDLVILNSLIVHKSLNNFSKFCRLTAQFRLSLSKNFKWN